MCARYLFTQIKHCICSENIIIIARPLPNGTPKLAKLFANPWFCTLFGCRFGIGQSSETDSCDPLKNTIKKKEQTSNYCLSLQQQKESIAAYQSRIYERRLFMQSVLDTTTVVEQGVSEWVRFHCKSIPNRWFSHLFYMFSKVDFYLVFWVVRNIICLVFKLLFVLSISLHQSY